MTNASIGQVGGRPYTDSRNDRVKGFGDVLQTSPAMINSSLRRALKALGNESRFTIRLPISRGVDLESVKRISVNHGQIKVTCEAIILVNNEVISAIAYFGGNRPERQTSTQIVEAEKQCLKNALVYQPKKRGLTNSYTVKYSAPRSNSWSPLDITRLVEIYDLAFLGYLTDFTEESVEGMLTDNLVALLYRKEKIVSVVMAEIANLSLAGQNISLAEISEVATHPEFQRQGFARLLYRVVIEKLHQMQTDVIFTEARANSTGILIAASSNGLVPMGRLEQHCVISSKFTDVRQEGIYGNLFVLSL